MITHKTALVLGAGASMPYGFPSGYDLKIQIVNDLEPGHKRPMHRHIRDAGFSSDEIDDFRTALHKSGKRSVDAFLEHRREFLKVGKNATACALLPCESEDQLFANGGAGWYEYLFNKLNAGFEEFDKNSLSVLTFNYDRSVEQYLITALTNAYGKNLEACVEKLRTIPIVHLHGQLGDLPPLGDRGIEYGAAISPEALTIASEGIQIIHEDISHSPQFEQAHKLLRGADRVCFLGFGYDPTNLTRLLSYGPTLQQSVSGSAMGFTGRECYFIQEDIRRHGFREFSLDYIYGDALDFLRHHCPFD